MDDVTSYTYEGALTYNARVSIAGILTGYFEMRGYPNVRVRWQRVSDHYTFTPTYNMGTPIIKGPYLDLGTLRSVRLAGSPLLWHLKDTLASEGLKFIDWYGLPLVDIDDTTNFSTKELRLIAQGLTYVVGDSPKALSSHAPFSIVTTNNRVGVLLSNLIDAADNI